MASSAIQSPIFGGFCNQSVWVDSSFCQIPSLPLFFRRTMKLDDLSLSWLLNADPEECHVFIYNIGLEDRYRGRCPKRNT